MLELSLYTIMLGQSCNFFLKCLFETGFHYAIQADLELSVILLPRPCWDYRHDRIIGMCHQAQVNCKLFMSHFALNSKL